MRYRRSNHFPRPVGKLWLAMALILLSACSTDMPTRQSGFLSDYHHLSPMTVAGGQALKSDVPVDPAHITITDIQWRVKDDHLTPTERNDLLNTLRSELQTQLNHLPANPGGRSADVRAAITNVVTVSPSLNVLSTALIAAPLDRGGAAVEIEAIDSQTRQQLAALNLGYYSPMSDIKARFSKLASARIALDHASEDFGQLLRP
ncbi:DUF3313 family protein [Martelella alba]|uniref:DUF3313 domain-containing protein n=1 Tax=Martelella alba TaxID=2590451 RepID=A0ABY2SGZ4_9HYPH|nr:DUF3313 family protein [Martelella alba]TKI04472.1 DUF3313 domain-containing protein [Martelella alba]